MKIYFDVTDKEEWLARLIEGGRISGFKIERQGGVPIVAVLEVSTPSGDHTIEFGSGRDEVTVTMPFNDASVAHCLGLKEEDKLP